MLHRVFFILGLFLVSLSLMVAAMVIGNLSANHGQLTDPGLAYLVLAMVAIGSTAIVLAQRARRRMHIVARTATHTMIANAGYAEASVIAMVLRCSLDDTVALLDDWAEDVGAQRVQLRGFDVRYYPKS